MNQKEFLEALKHSQTCPLAEESKLEIILLPDGSDYYILSPDIQNNEGEPIILKNVRYFLHGTIDKDMLIGILILCLLQYKQKLIFR